MTILEWVLGLAVVFELLLIWELRATILKNEKRKHELARELDYIRNLYHG